MNRIRAELVFEIASSGRAQTWEVVGSPEAGGKSAKRAMNQRGLERFEKEQTSDITITTSLMDKYID